MRFHSKLLQPPSSDSEPTISKIHTVYRTPGGNFEGDENLAEILERDYARLVKLGARPKPLSKIREA